MRKVFIVFRNGKVDGVYDNLEAAMSHHKNLVKKWSITYVQDFDVWSI